MKALPKRKGNLARQFARWLGFRALMKVPPKRKGNLSIPLNKPDSFAASMKALPKRKGNECMPRRGRAVRASIKVYTSSCRTSSPSAILDHHNSLVLLRVPPKRKRNPCLTASASTLERSLNESPYEKVEKYCFEGSHCCIRNASIKAPLKRKGNRNAAGGTPAVAAASMKALPKRKGNKGPIRGDEFREAASMKVYISSSRTSSRLVILSHHNSLVLIESPYKLYGNSQNFGFATPRRCCLNESPSKKEGKS